MTMPNLPAQGDKDWYDWAQAVDTEARKVNAGEVGGGLEDADVAGLVADDQTQTGAALKGAFGPLADIAAPDGFALTALNYTVHRSALGQYLVDLDVEALRPPEGATYYIAPNGTAGASGLTEAEPTRLSTAVGKADVGTIVFLPGEYFRNDHTGGTITKSLRLIARPGAILTGFEKPGNLTWTLVSGAVYSTTRSVTQGVVDKRDQYLSADGDYPVYVQKADLASVTGPGQWATDGSAVHVWALDNANLATDSSFLRLNLQAGSTAVLVEGGHTLYIEGLQIEGGGDSGRGAVDARMASGSTARPRVICVDTTIKYAQNKGFRLDGAEFGVFVRCTAQSTGGDGFSYHTTTRNSVGYAPDVIEIDCTTRRTGLDPASQTENGSTGHGVSRILRINGLHLGSHGPALAEDSGATSWNLAVVAGDSRAPSRFWPYCVSGDGSQMWLEDCAALPSPGPALYAYGTSTIHTRRPRTGSVLGMRGETRDSGQILTY